MFSMPQPQIDTAWKKLQAIGVCDANAAACEVKT
jgi:hypothetical protein